MALSEDLNVFLDDFGVSCTAGAVSALGILDMPSQIIGDMVLSTDYQVTAKTSDFGTLLAGASITVDSVAYKVRETRQIGDGLLCEISLQKV